MSNEPNFQKGKNEYNLLQNKGLWKKSSQSTMQKRTQAKPKFTHQSLGEGKWLYRFCVGS
jgi:hypothetical protein